MNLKNESYTILIHGKSWTERYYRDKAGWVKQSTRGREFRATAEQVLNHLLPALAGIKPGVVVEVEHHETECERQRNDLRRATVHARDKAARLAGGGASS